MLPLLLSLVAEAAYKAVAVWPFEVLGVPLLSVAMIHLLVQSCPEVRSQAAVAQEARPREVSAVGRTHL